MNTNAIISGKTENGVCFLELFFKDYQLVIGERPNAGCAKCINDYLNKYKLKISQMENPKIESAYKLFPKYENIPLTLEGDGYNIYVNNDNITDKMAKILLKRYDKEFLFEIYPIDKTNAKTA